MMNINYLGTAFATRIVLPSMKSRRKGKIVILSSVGGLIGLYGFTGYGASKAALRGFSEALQMEVKPYGISVTLGFPPDTDTPGLLEENKFKPTETKLISESAGVYPADIVAENLLRDTLTGDFFSSTGFDGNLSTVICAGMSPMSSVAGLVIQVI
jgi:3-dehydrosphinganine reductase